jgi:hypothetical protein
VVSRVKPLQSLKDEICDRIAEGESLRAICRDDAMPAASTVFKWLAQDAQFAEHYARSREAQADTMADEILAIADDTARDTIVTDKGDTPDNEWIARSRLRVDARKWLASKMAPKKYGEKIGIEHSGTVELASALEAARKRVQGDE